MDFLVSYVFLVRSPGINPRRFQRLASIAPVMLDSGAFTAYTRGERIDLAAYGDFCAAHQSLLWGYVQLDVVKDAQRTRDNFRSMVARGLRPMPVITLGEPEGVAEELVEVNPRICVAGGVTDKPMAYSARLERVWRASGCRALLHGLGYTRGVEPLRSRVASVDSSSWANGYRYGTLCCFDPFTGITHRQFNEFVGRRAAQLPAPLMSYLVRCGVSLQQLQSCRGSRVATSLRAFLSLHAWAQYSRLLASRGIKCFFAVGRDHQLHQWALLAAHDMGDWVDVRGALEDSDSVVRMWREDDDAFFDYFRRALARDVWTKNRGECSG